MELWGLFLCAFLLAPAPTKGFQSKLNDRDVIDPNYNETDLSEVYFWLWTRTNAEDDDSYELLYEDFPVLIESPFDDSKRTYFLIHGWGGNGKEGWILDTKTNLLTWSDCQVISIDYTTLASATNYDKAVYDMYNVAEYAASFIDWLVENTLLTTQQIHITGHSLGGQAAGLTAHKVASGLIDRVTGLDPAGPLFYTKSPDERIDKSDAAFVDIIHSNSGSLEENCIGLFEPVGDVDFYPNGGKHQPGCNKLTDTATGCSHARSHDYWIESILADHDDDAMKQFWSYECSDIYTYLEGTCFDSPSLTMGFHVNRSLTGTFFLQTNEVSPFAQGKQP